MSKSTGTSVSNQIETKDANETGAIMKRARSRAELGVVVQDQMQYSFQQILSQYKHNADQDLADNVFLSTTSRPSGSGGDIIRGWIKEAIESTDRVIRVAGVALKNAFTEAVDTIWKGKKKHNDVPRPYESREDGLESIVYNALAKLYNVFARFIEVAGSALGIERARDVAEKITNKAKKFEKIADTVYSNNEVGGKKFTQNVKRSEDKHSGRSSSTGGGLSLS